MESGEGGIGSARLLQVGGERRVERTEGEKAAERRAAPCRLVGVKYLMLGIPPVVHDPRQIINSGIL